MIELGELEAHHQQFAQKNARVVVASLEDQAKAEETQKQFPHLVVVADPKRKLAETLEVMHRKSAPDGSDTTAPTTVILDGSGTVRWTFRPQNALTRLSPGEVLAALEQHVGKG
jgi:peroxiredoxin